MPNLLLICPHFPPTAASGSFRLLGFSRHLPKFGWKTTVVACSPVPWEPVDAALASRIPAESRVTYVEYPQGRMPRSVNLGLRAAGVLDRYWLWGRLAAEVCRRIIRDGQVDAILTSGPPHSVHLLGRRLKREFGLPWIADFRDPWAGNGGRGAMQRRIAGFLEEIVVRRADAVIANAPLACEAMRLSHSRYAAKIRTITNGFDPEPYPVPRSPVAGRAMRIVHTGEIYAGRDPRPLFDALAALRRAAYDLVPPELTFVGRVECLDVAKEASDRGLASQIRVEPQVAYEEACRRMGEADVLLLLDSPGRLQGVPAKLYEYLGRERPILALAEPDGDTAWVLRSSGIPHAVARPQDVEAITQAIAHLSAVVWNPGRSADWAGAAAFSRENAAGKLAAVLEDAVERVKHGQPRLASQTAVAEPVPST